MRPAGEVRVALMDAAIALARPNKGATMRELAQVACVGVDAARRTVENMARAGQLRRLQNRRVAYRNRPVAEYVPAEIVDQSNGYVDIASVCKAWAG